MAVKLNLKLLYRSKGGCGGLMVSFLVPRANCWGNLTNCGECPVMD